MARELASGKAGHWGGRAEPPPLRGGARPLETDWTGRAIIRRRCGFVYGVSSMTRS